jgi:hypothetical protein
MCVIYKLEPNQVAKMDQVKGSIDCNQTHTIFLAALKNNKKKPSAHWQNNATGQIAKWAHGVDDTFYHVACAGVWFPYSNPGEQFSTTIFQNSKVVCTSLGPLSLNQEEYHFLAIEITSAQKDHMVKDIIAATNNTEFSIMKMLASTLPLGNFFDDNINDWPPISTICSSYVTLLLKRAKVTQVQHLNSNYTSPTMLWMALKDTCVESKGVFLASLPSRNAAIMHKDTPLNF